MKQIWLTDIQPLVGEVYKTTFQPLQNNVDPNDITLLKTYKQYVIRKINAKIENKCYIHTINQQKLLNSSQTSMKTHTTC